MLDVNVEFSKGVLFIRLSGNINSVNSINIKSNITNIIKEGGIKYLLFNIDNLKIKEKIDLFEKCNELIKINNGKMIICGINDNFNIVNDMHILDYCENATDELSALRMIRA